MYIMTLSCPHCGIHIEIAEINCGIFRCGIYKTTGQQLPPHLSKTSCDALKNADKIWGCSRPFRYEEGKLVKCEYV